MGGVLLTAEPDASAPHVGSVLQQRMTLKPTGRPTRQLLLAYSHGSGSTAGTINATQPANTPGFPNELSPHNQRYYRRFAERGIPVVGHDFSGLNPATGAMDVQQFGSKAVMDLFEAIRTDLAPKLGCRADRIMVGGESQGAGAALLYLLTHPAQCAAVVLSLPGADTELDRFGPPGVHINQNWGFASPYTQTIAPNSLALGPGGPRLNQRGTYRVGVAYAQYDMVTDPASVGPYGSTAWWRSTAGTSSASTAAHDPGWTPLNPTDAASFHYVVPSEGGNALPFPSGTAGGLAGLPASIFEPANITRMADIISGRLTGTPVPVYAFVSLGDAITMATGTNGVPDHFRWYASKVGIHVTKISDVMNHSGHPQPTDPALSQTFSISSGQSAVFTPGANGELVVKLNRTWSGTLLVEVSTNGTTYTTIPTTTTAYARSTVATVADDIGWTTTAGGGTEGPAVSTITASGYWRIVASGYVKMRIRKTSGTGTATIVGGPVYPNDCELSAIPTDWLCAQLLQNAA